MASRLWLALLLTAQAQGLASVGIDLGTTMTVVATHGTLLAHDAGLFRSDSPGSKTIHVLEDSQGSRVTPSMVTFTKDEVFVGMPSRNSQMFFPRSTVYAAKRLVGQRFHDPQTQELIRELGFEVEPCPEEIVLTSPKNVTVVLREFHQRVCLSQSTTFLDAPLPIEFVSSLVLRTVMEVASKKLGVPVTDAVITVPAYFEEPQRQATLLAAQIAGIRVLRLLAEPTAAALSYAARFDPTGILLEHTIVVFDFGGGTLDVSVLKYNQGHFQVLGVGGDNRLGGEDVDNAIASALNSKFLKDSGINLMSDAPRAYLRVRRAAEEAKRALSTATSYKIFLDNLIDGRDFSALLTRARLESLSEGVFSKLRSILENLVSALKLDVGDVRTVLMVGGSSRIPKVQEIVRDFFKQEPKRFLNTDEAVAEGAAVMALRLTDPDGFSNLYPNLEIRDIVARSIRNTHCGKGGCEPGTGKMREDGKFMESAVIIPRFEPLPARKTARGTTGVDNQPGLQFDVVEGEDGFAVNNRFLGRMSLTGIQQAPAGTPQILTEFEVDENGILRVSARDTHTHASNTIVVKNLHGLEVGLEELTSLQEMVEGLLLNKGRDSGTAAEDDWDRKDEL